jgi:adenine-specific DNA-methyltransferase
MEMEYKIYKRFRLNNTITLYEGNCFNLLKRIPDNSIDLIVTSPPYCIGKAYEHHDDDINTCKARHKKIFPFLHRILKPGGSICWQIGYHVFSSEIIPLDYIVYDIFTSKNLQFDKDNRINLRNRIIWTFGHGLNSERRFSGRHEVILWFTKGEHYQFDLDRIRVPQKYPGKRSYKGDNKGEFSGNPLGKNPSDVWDVTTDVWDIPNVKAQHIEKTNHPCQFPVAIPRRLIKALVPKGGVVLDPYMGTGTSGVAAVLENCKFVGAELSKEYYDISTQRMTDAISGSIRIREDKPVLKPNPNMAVAKLPELFAEVRGINQGEKKEEETEIREKNQTSV